MSDQKKTKKLQIIHGLGLGLIAIVIFLTGWGVGNGKIVLSQDQLFRKSVQKNLPADLDYETVEEVYDALKEEFDGQLTIDQLLEGIKTGLVNGAGDTYTEFLTPKEAQDFEEALNGTFIGIGAELSKDKDGNIVVVAPISGFPAEKAGLKPKDIIIGVNGESTNNQSINDVVSKIRGDENTTVKLRIIRNKSEDLNFEIKRQKITIPSVKSEIKSGNIGYLRVTRFAEDTAGLVKQSAKDFEKAKVKGIVLDLRNNPGGLLDASVDISSLWLKEDSVVLQEKRDGKVIKTYRAKGDALFKGVPTIVLINEGSASASEITAGALQDNGAATLLGVKSFGKGSVQNLEKFSDGSVLKVTIARWFTPNGVNIDKEGIKPGKEVKNSESTSTDKDAQLEAALKQLQN